MFIKLLNSLFKEKKFRRDNLKILNGELPQKQSEAAPSPRTFDPKKARILLEGYKLYLKPGTKRYVLFQYLLSKLVFGKEDFHIEEYIVLFELYMDLTEEKTPTFQEKRKNLIEIEEFFKILSGTQVFPIRVDFNPIQEEHVKSFLGEVLLSPNSYYGIKGNRDITQSYSLRINTPVTPQRFSKAFIGVGYKDKGTVRNVSRDGTPHWKEVASYFSNLEREREEKLETDPHSQTRE